MFQILIIILVMLIAQPSEASYKIFLRNGSVIEGVSSYEERNGEVAVEFRGGSIGIPKRDILRIEEAGTPEKDFRTPVLREKDETAPPAAAPAEDRGAKLAELRAELESVNTELKAVEEDEARLKASINEKQGRRFSYNVYQLKRLQQELEPLQQELYSIQQRKNELEQRKARIESGLREAE